MPNVEVFYLIFHFNSRPDGTYSAHLWSPVFRQGWLIFSLQRKLKHCSSWSCMCMPVCVCVWIMSCYWLQINHQVALAGAATAHMNRRLYAAAGSAVASRAVQAARSMMDGGARRVGPVRLMTAGPERLNDLLNLKITPKKTHFMCNLQPRSKIPSKAIWIWMSTCLFSWWSHQADSCPDLAQHRRASRKNGSLEFSQLQLYPARHHLTNRPVRDLAECRRF